MLFRTKTRICDLTYHNKIRSTSTIYVIICSMYVLIKELAFTSIMFVHASNGWKISQLNFVSSGVWCIILYFWKYFNYYFVISILIWWFDMRVHAFLLCPIFVHKISRFIYAIADLIIKWRLRCFWGLEFRFLDISYKLS